MLIAWLNTAVYFFVARWSYTPLSLLFYRVAPSMHSYCQVAMRYMLIARLSTAAYFSVARWLYTLLSLLSYRSVDKGLGAIVNLIH